MEKPKKTYANAGMQTRQGWREARRLYWDAADTDYITVPGIALILGINRNWVKKIPVKRYMIDKRGYYLKGEIKSWMEEDLARPDSLLKQLQEDQRKIDAKQKAQPSRIYNPSSLTKEEAQQAKAKSEKNKTVMPTDPYELSLIDWKASRTWGGKSTAHAQKLMDQWMKATKKRPKKTK